MTKYSTCSCSNFKQLLWHMLFDLILIVLETYPDILFALFVRFAYHSEDWTIGLGRALRSLTVILCSWYLYSVRQIGIVVSIVMICMHQTNRHCCQCCDDLYLYLFSHLCSTFLFSSDMNIMFYWFAFVSQICYALF